MCSCKHQQILKQESAIQCKDIGILEKIGCTLPEKNLATTKNSKINPSSEKI